MSYGKFLYFIMKLINENVQKITQSPGLQGVYKQIETAARICYLSQPTTLSSEEFVKGLIKKGHLSPLAHGTVYLTIPRDTLFDFTIQVKNNDIWSKIKINTFDDNCYVTTNYRRLYELDKLDWLCYLSEPTEQHFLRTTYQVTTSIGISRELNRHATALAICESSTRYCNFSKEKFGSEIKFITPHWFENASEVEKLLLINNLKNAEKTYLALIEEGLKPQDARSVLPLQTVTTAIYTGYDVDWKRIWELRGANNAHPECQKIIKLMSDLNK